MWDKPAFGDGVVAEITSSTRPTVGTIRPGVLAAADPQAERRAGVVEHAVDLPRLMVTPQYAVTRAEDRQPIGTARTVIGVGMGAVPYLRDIERLAEQLGAAVGYTRKVVDAGHGRRIDQIGLSGASIAPDLYIAVGISGAIEHAVGITRAQRILAIDADEDSFMFEYADVAVIGDGEPLVRRLADALAEARGPKSEEELCTPA